MRPSRKVLNHLRRLREYRRTGTPPHAALNDVSHNAEPNPTQNDDSNISGDFVMEVVAATEQQPHFSVEGRRIVNISFFLDQIKSISQHGALGCNYSYIEITGEHRIGLTSKFNLVCRMCNERFVLSTEELKANRMNVNHEAVSGFMSTGSGYTQLRTVSAAMGIPPPSFKLYTSVHDTVCDWWDQTAVHCMAVAAKQEADYAISIGNVTECGTPFITVVADGCWSKRSYRYNYSALSGAAVIIGHKFGKVLHLGIKNKYCIICSRSACNNDEPPQHKCYKNYSGPSTAMESHIILEGFLSSVKEYGLIYNKLIADGDSSTYKKILESRPYGDLTVEKIECKNHLLRNYCKALVNLSTDTRYPCEQRKIVKDRYLRLRKGVECAIRHWGNQNVSFDEKIVKLYEDIQNGPHHVFGNHINCSIYFCPPNNRRYEEVNFVHQFEQSGIFGKLEDLSCKLSRQSRSLIYNVTSNIVESYNAQVAKFVGGKRINYSLRRSYSGRCIGALVSFNTGALHSVTHEVIFGTKANSVISRVEELTKSKVKKAVRKKKVSRTSSVLKDSHYGPQCQQPDMDNNLFEEAKLAFLNKLNISNLQRQQLERRTILQSSSGEWLGIRRKLLTSSWFGKVCKRGNAISCAPLVKSILYASNLSNVPSVKYGRDNEQIAISQLSAQTGLLIENCGLFIDEEHCFLGSSPDGKYADGIVEVKCPSTLSNLSHVEAKKKHAFWKLDKHKTYILNKNHDWYYQVQGQLHITKSNVCMFAAWLGEGTPLIVHIIERDDDFWKINMEPKLLKFYNECLLPELVDPRIPRSMDIRNPPDILRALEEKNKKKCQTSINGCQQASTSSC